ncbi:PREDICTED: nucleoprotein TPR-like [Eufriesea mexicana]|uniref:nucleoprotein TPR-like n=1 Tax=Eufriesea mexicana TaxID=516756 RepID=UPI00083C3A31|nr:PREDICTED: nucleoprotein TPR-like [Eufriesea mexicana]
MNEYLENCESIETNDDEGFKEKTRIAEVAAATLCRLNSIMKQMKDWRDDRMKLRSNIWRLKLALRVAGRETDDTLHADPLIEHQRAEIKRLETANKELKKEIANIKSALLNDGYVTEEVTWKSNDKLVEVKQGYLIERERLNNEIQYLKSRLSEVEEGHEHSSEVEHLKCKLKHFMMVDYTMEIIFTDIVNKVAETIANLSEELVNVNERLHRSRMKNDSLYVEIDKLKATLRFKSGNLVDYQKRIAELDNLTKHLKMELKIVKINYGDNWGSDSNFQNSLKNFERLVQDLRNKLKNDHEALLAGGDPDCLKYIQKIIELRINLKQLHVELAKLTDDVHFSCPEKITECNRYLKQLSTLDSTLKEINDEIDKLKNNHVKKHYGIDCTGGLEYLNKIEELETMIEKARSTMNGLNRRAEGKSNGSKDIEELEDFVGRVCHEIKQLEVIVVSNDRSSGFKRIEQLEDSIVQLKTELNEKDEHVNVLNQKLCDTENLMEHRMKELEDAQKKIVVLMVENEDLKGKMKRTEERSTEIQRELEDSKKEIEQLQQENEKLQARTNELERIRCKRETTNVERENESMKRSRETAEKMNVELQQLKVNLAISKESLDNANREIADLKVKLDCISGEKTKLQTDVFHLESKKEMLVFQLDTEKATAEGRLRDITKLQSDYNELDVKMANLKKEKEHLNTHLTSLRIEKDVLEKSLKHVHDKCSILEDEIDRYKAEREGLIEEVRNFRTSNENLSDKLEKIQTDLDGAGDKIKRQELENSRLHDDLNRLTLKNAGLEGRLQALLVEKSELTTRINELNEETVALKDQLDEVKKARECSNVELSKLKIEYNKSTSENKNLRSQLDEVKQSNGTLKEANEDLKLRANEIHSECRILGNQLKILEGMNAILKKEKKLLEQEYMNSLRSKVSKIEKNGTVAYNESNFSNEQTETKQTKSGKRASDKAKAAEAKEGLKKLMVENESLRFEILNLRSQNFEVKMQLTRMKDELQRQKDELEKRISETAIKPISNKLEIVNLYYKEINSYSGHGLGNMSAVTRFGQSSVCPYDDATTEQENVTEIENLLEIMNKLKVENVALKMEVNSLRCNLVVNFTEDEKRRNEIRIAAEEIQALKAELTKLRDEKESLRVRLDTSGTKLDWLESEKAALKDELYSLRKINADLKHKASEFRNDYQKLKEKSVGFEGCIVRAIKKIKKYTMNADNQASPDDELKVLLKKYISNEEILYSIEQRINIDET